MTMRPRKELDAQLVLGRDFVLDLEELGALWGRCFGTAPRGWAWVNRKFHREYFRPDLSSFARDPQGKLVGFFAVGEASAPLAHAMGLGVAPLWRGRDLGRRLIASSIEALRESNAFEALECEVMPGPAAVYERAGLLREASCAHLLAHGTGGAVEGVRSSERPESAVSFWRERSWMRTPVPDRRVCEVPAGRFGLTRERSAWLIHWFDGHELREGLEQLRACFDSPSAIVFYGMAESHPDFTPLLDTGWHAAQSFARYRLAL